MEMARERRALDKWSRVSIAGILACWAILSWPPSAGWAAETSTPEAREILQQMTEALREAKQLQFHAELTHDEMPIPGLVVQIAGAMDVALRRPDGLRLEYRDDLAAKTVWYDGASLTLVDWGAGVVASAQAPATLDGALARFEERHGLTLPLAELLTSDPHRALLARAVKGTYVGMHDVEGVACHHLAFLQDHLDWEIWVDSGEIPVPRKLLIRYKQEPGFPQYEALLMDWNLEAQLPDESFQAEVPSEVVAVEFLALEEASR